MDAIVQQLSGNRYHLYSVDQDTPNAFSQICENAAECQTWITLYGANVLVWRLRAIGV